MAFKPEVKKVKSHITVNEAIIFGRTNTDIGKWIVCNEAADGAAGTEADHRGSYEKELTKEKYMKAKLTIVLKRISAIEMDIRNKDERVPDTVEGIIAAAASQAQTWCAESTMRTKRKIELLEGEHGHRLREPDDNDEWCRCN